MEKYVVLTLVNGHILGKYNDTGGVIQELTEVLKTTPNLIVQQPGDIIAQQPGDKFRIIFCKSYIYIQHTNRNQALFVSEISEFEIFEAEGDDEAILKFELKYNSI